MYPELQEVLLRIEQSARRAQRVLTSADATASSASA